MKDLDFSDIVIRAFAIVSLLALTIAIGMTLALVGSMVRDAWQIGPHVCSRI